MDFKSTLFVGNLPFITRDEQIRAFFAQFGKIDYVRTIRDSLTHTTKGFCYVKMALKSDLDEIIKIVRARSVAETRQLMKMYYKGKGDWRDMINDEGQIVFQNRNLRINKAKKSLVKSRKIVKPNDKDDFTKRGAEPRASLKRQQEIQKDVKAISKGVRMGTGGYDVKMMENVIRNNVVAPQALVRKKIKKIERQTGLTSEQKVKRIVSIQKKQNNKLRVEVIETEGLLKKRRQVKKMKKRMNARSMRQNQK